MTAIVGTLLQRDSRICSLRLSSIRLSSIAKIQHTFASICIRQSPTGKNLIQLISVICILIDSIKNNPGIHRSHSCPVFIPFHDKSQKSSQLLLSGQSSLYCCHLDIYQCQSTVDCSQFAKGPYMYCSKYGGLFPLMKLLLVTPPLSTFTKPFFNRPPTTIIRVHLGMFTNKIPKQNLFLFKFLRKCVSELILKHEIILALHFRWVNRHEKVRFHWESNSGAELANMTLAFTTELPRHSKGEQTDFMILLISRISLISNDFKWFHMISGDFKWLQAIFKSNETSREFG